MTDREVFRDNLQYYFGLTKTSQIDLANYLGVSKQTVSAWVCLRGYPRIDTMQQIADFFGVNTTDIVSEHKANTEEMTANEIELIRIYRSLSADGKRSLMDQARMHSMVFGKKSNSVSSEVAR